jgi:hypothetical protein
VADEEGPTNPLTLKGERFLKRNSGSLSGEEMKE